MELRRLHQQQLAIKSEILKRRDGDPLLSFEPHKKQQLFIDSLLTGGCRQAWFLAANRSGKSDAGAYIGATFARYGAPGIKEKSKISDRATSGWVVSLDYRASQEVIQPKYFDNGFVPPGAHLPFIPDREIDEWRVSDQILKLKNGSIIGFKSCESPRTKFQGAEKDWIHFDEEPPEGHFEEAVIRVGKRPLILFSTCTLLPPLGVAGGITWVFEKIIKPFQAGALENVKLFSASIYDNPHIGREEIRLLESIYAIGSTQRRIRLDGEWLPGLSGTRCYPGFNKQSHVKEQHEHYNPGLPLAWYFDFNVAPFISGIGQRQGDLFRSLDEFVLEEGSHVQMVDLFMQKYGNHPGEVWIYGDATGGRRSAQTSVSDYTLICNELTRHRIFAKLKVPTINPNPNDRLNAVSRLFQDEEGKSLYEVDPCCSELISDFEMVLRDSRGGIKKSHNQKESYYRRTHASDGFGYWVAYESPVVSTGNRSKRNFKQDIGIPRYGFANQKM